jgi:hypothetical protein
VKKVGIHPKALPEEVDKQHDSALNGCLSDAGQMRKPRQTR